MADFYSSETFLTVFRKKLKEAKEREKDNMSSIVNPHDDYIERVGFIRGINEALILFDETEKQFFPRN